MTRIGLLQVLQESNSFNPVLTTQEQFRAYGVASGPAVIETYGTTGGIGGFMEGLREAAGAEIEPVGIVRMQASPGGPASVSTLEWIAGLVRENLEKAGPLDALLCALHGAMVAENEEDVEGFLLQRIREQIGTTVPVVVSLDLHAYITESMLRHADVMVPYHTSPHLDIKETGMRATRVLARLLGGAKQVVGFQRLPMISIAEAQNTEQGPLAPLFRMIREWEARGDVLSTGVLMTQAWLDVGNLGWSTLVVTDDNAEAARDMAAQAADESWSLRNRLIEEFHSAAECVRLGLAHETGPVIIADGADSMNSGGGGDSTHLLREMLATPIPGGALVIMVDPAAVAEAKRAGKSESFRFAVGGKRDNLFSKPLPVEGRVLSTTEARYTLTGHGAHNLPVDMGSAAVVRLKDVTLLLVERPGPGGTPLMYRCAGLEPKDFKMVVVKSPAGFRADFGPFASRILLADCPGCASPHFENLPYTKYHKPLEPLQEIADRREVRWIQEERRQIENLLA